MIKKVKRFMVKIAYAILEMKKTNPVGPYGGTRVILFKDGTMRPIDEVWPWLESYHPHI